ncbi:hypothetical protein WJX77_009547 [Trebouxia sp. C0004]
MRDRQAMPKDYSCRQIQQAQRGLFLRFLLSLVKDPDTLRSHASNNARIPWFHKRIKCKPQECSIISTTWMFSQYCEWKHDLGQFADGQNVLKTVGDSQRLKGQDTAEGMSEYFIVIPGGIETLDEALKQVPISGLPSISSSPSEARTSSSPPSYVDRPRIATRGVKRAVAQTLQENYPSPLPVAKQKGFRSGRVRPEGLRILADVSANILR